MNYRDQIIRHLGEYKKKTLGILEPGIYRYNKEYLEKDHILPTATGHSCLNILEPYRDEFFADAASSHISYHQYFHHLNSSQAMCINLFYPLMKEQQSKLILGVLDTSGQIRDYAFEKESPLEKTPKNSRKTNFDFYLETEENQKIFFEIKFTEDGFGKAKNDAAHREKFSQTYEPLLVDNKHINPDYKEMDTFLKHYQILRNLVHIQENSTVVFLFPEKNTRVKKQAEFARDNILTDKGRDRFRIIYLNDFVRCLTDETTSPLLNKHYSQFRGKYLPPTI